MVDKNLVDGWWDDPNQPEISQYKTSYAKVGAFPTDAITAATNKLIQLQFQPKLPYTVSFTGWKPNLDNLGISGHVVAKVWLLHSLEPTMAIYRPNFLAVNVFLSHWDALYKEPESIYHALKIKLDLACNQLSYAIAQWIEKTSLKFPSSPVDIAYSGQVLGGKEVHVSILGGSDGWPSQYLE